MVGSDRRAGCHPSAVIAAWPTGVRGSVPSWELCWVRTHHSTVQIGTDRLPGLQERMQLAEQQGLTAQQLAQKSLKSINAGDRAGWQLSLLEP